MCGGSQKVVSAPPGLTFVVISDEAKKAMAEAKRFGETYEACTSADKNHSYIPQELTIKPDTAYLHITANNTIYGTEWQNFPEVSVPVICDMSSDILSRSVDVKKFSLIYAGAQKNLGPAGVVIVIVKKAFLETARTGLPPMLSYQNYADNDSLYNTPPVFAIYMVNKTLHWIKAQGGVAALEKVNIEKAKLLYDYLDQSKLFKGTVEKKDRSLMNVPFVTGSDELDAKFVKEAKEAGLENLKGHRTVGGMRASIYNAMPYEGVEALVAFMKKFEEENL